MPFIIYRLSEIEEDVAEDPSWRNVGAWPSADIDCVLYYTIEQKEGNGHDITHSSIAVRY